MGPADLLCRIAGQVNLNLRKMKILQYVFILNSITNYIIFMKSKIYSIILARGGSKGIKNKNLVSINNKPLIFWTIIQCLNSKKIDKFWES